MIGVAENDLGAERFDNVLGDRFYAARGADGHEDGGLDCLVGKKNLCAATAGTIFAKQVELKTHRAILSVLRGKPRRSEPVTKLQESNLRPQRLEHDAHHEPTI
jgi:hypothetical protein